MFKAVEQILMAEKKAKEIVDAANIQAEQISRDTESKLAEVYKKAYEEAIDEANRRSIELINKIRKKKTLEIDQVHQIAEDEIATLRKLANTNFSAAVDYVLKTIMQEE